MLPDAFKDKKITFVLGAGASMPFIRNGAKCLSTDYLTEQITNRDRWSAIYNEFKQAIPQSRFPQQNFNVSLDDILAIIEKLKAINELKVNTNTRERAGGWLPQKIDDVYGIGKINFEHILYLLDKVSNYLHDRKNSVDNILFDLWGEHTGEKESLRWLKKGWNYVPFLCREVLVNAIFDLWESCPKEQAIEVNRRFFASILEKFERVSIYSLNYDPLLYEAVKKIRARGLKKIGKRKHEVDKSFETGFSGGKNFNLKELYLVDNIIAFLHGHVGFVPEGGKDSMRFDENYLKAQKKRIKGVADETVKYVRQGVKGIHYNVSITSGLDKFESLYENPYACYIQRFSEDFMESDYIVLIGTALNDYHLNLFIANALLVANGYSPDPQNLLALRKMVFPKKIVIVTLEPEETTWEGFFASGQGTAIHNLLKNGILVENGHRVDGELREKRYAQINKDFFLYLKGTEEFFSEIDKILVLF